MLLQAIPAKGQREELFCSKMLMISPWKAHSLGRAAMCLAAEHDFFVQGRGHFKSALNVYAHIQM